MSDDFTIKVLEESDSEALEYCTHRLSIQWKSGMDEIRKLLTCCAQRQDGRLCVIGLLDGQCVGMVVVYLHDEELHPTYGPWLNGLYVEERFRNTSLTMRLLARARLEVKASGIRKIYFSANQPELKERYARLGFKVVEVVSWHNKPVSIFVAEF